jgi:hypothetical protein
MQDSYSQEHIIYIYIYICLGSQSLTSVTVAISMVLLMKNWPLDKHSREA